MPLSTTARTMTVIAAITMLTFLAFAGMRVGYALLALKLGATAFTVGIIASMLAIIPMIFAVRWGRHIDRVGVRGPLITGIACVLAGGLIVFAVPRLETLFIASPLSGSGFMLMHIAVNQATGLTGDPEDRARNFGILALAFSASSVLGPTVAGFLIDAVGHRHTFLVLAGIAVLPLLLVVFRPPLVPRPAHEAKPGKKRLMDLLRIRSMRAVFIVSGLLSMCWDLYTFVMPIHATSLGLSASMIGLILGVFGAAVFCIRLVIPLVAHRLSEWKMLIGAMAVTGTALACIPMVSDLRLLLVLSFILGAGLGGAQPMIMALLYAKAPPGRGGEAVGVRTLLLNLSQSSIPLLFGALGAAMGMTPVFVLMAVTLWAGGWYAARHK